MREGIRVVGCGHASLENLAHFVPLWKVRGRVVRINPCLCSEKASVPALALPLADR